MNNMTKISQLVKMLDIIILGATGSTGMHCIPQMHKFANYSGRNIKWGIAGRSIEKVKHTLVKIGRKIDTDLSNIPVIICDIENEYSLLEMAQKTKIVINCVGPYILHGEKVVDACLKVGTDYIDASGEPQFMEKIQLTKNDLAKKKGVYIISACGFDSIPSDLGVTYLTQKFNGVLNSVVTYLELFVESKTLYNYATWESLVHNISQVEELKKIRKSLFKEKIPTLKPKLQVTTSPHQVSFIDGWIVPFPVADKSVIKRTQYYFYETEKRRPVQTETFIVFKKFQNIILWVLTSNIFFLLSKFESGRKLLLDHPRILSCGVFSKNNLTEINKENTKFQLTFYGEGWKEEVSDGTDQNLKPCNKKIIAKMSGRNPAYESSGLFLIFSAITLLCERDKLPGDECGGVYTPGAAFAKTSLMEFLLQNGMNFEILPEQNTLSSKL